jgi:putative tryptophan/tyrosine transport system substrate-binding protein
MGLQNWSRAPAPVVLAFNPEAGEATLKRRHFITVLGGAAAWSLTARAQQAERARRVGVVMGLDENDLEAKAWLSGFMRELAELGWMDGRNLRMDIRWPGGGIDRIRMFAKELVDLQPDVILAVSTPVTAVLQHETQTIPIVFTAVGDPIGDGFVASLSRPGGNITGFMIQEPAIAGKWLEMLKEIAPRVTRAVAMVNPETSPGGGSYFLAEFEAAARSLKVMPAIADVHSDADIEAVIAELGRGPGGGLVVIPSVFTVSRRASIIKLASQHKVPAVYRDPVNVKDGGLLS